MKWYIFLSVAVNCNTETQIELRDRTVEHFPGHRRDRRLALLVPELVGVRVQGVAVAASACLGHGEPHLRHVVYLRRVKHVRGQLYMTSALRGGGGLAQKKM